MIEEGIVTGLKKDAATVRIVKGKSCIGCGSSSGGSCHSGTGTHKERVIQVLNKSGVKVGDHVLIEIDSETVLKSSFLAYMFPLIFLFAGGIFGGWLAKSYPALGSTDMLASFFGFLFLFVSIFIVYFLNKNSKSSRSFKPVIKTILD